MNIISRSSADQNLINVGFLLIPRFSLMAFTSALEPLRVANQILDRPAYDWRIYGPDRATVEASNGLPVTPSIGIEEDDGWPDIFIVCSSYHEPGNISPQISKYLRRLARRNVVLGGISTGAEILAQCGLLDHHRAAIHWEYSAGFVENYPDVELSSGVYEIDKKRMTAAGGTASLDMILNWIAKDHGEALSAAISEQFIHDHIRPPGGLQQQAGPALLTRRSPKLADAARIMSQHLEEPLSPSIIAKQVGLSLRQLERLFRMHSRYTPQRYYLELRLERSRQLLLQTGMSVLEVAIATGFKSQSHFTKCYRERYSNTPTVERRAWLTGDAHSQVPAP